MRKKTSINFELDTFDSISSELLNVGQRFFRRNIFKDHNSVRFVIPMEIIRELQLEDGDLVYFIQYSEGSLMCFKNDNNYRRITYKTRKVLKMGTSYTVTIPPFIKNMFNKPIIAIELLHLKGRPDNEWQIKYLSSDFI